MKRTVKKVAEGHLGDYRKLAQRTWKLLVGPTGFYLTGNSWYLPTAKAAGHNMLWGWEGRWGGGRPQSVYWKHTSVCSAACYAQQCRNVFENVTGGVHNSESDGNEQKLQSVCESQCKPVQCGQLKTSRNAKKDASELALTENCQWLESSKLPEQCWNSLWAPYREYSNFKNNNSKFSQRLCQETVNNTDSKLPPIERCKSPSLPEDTNTRTLFMASRLRAEECAAVN